LSANQSSCSARSSRALYSYGSIVLFGKMRSHSVHLGFEGGDYCSFSFWEAVVFLRRCKSIFSFLGWSASLWLGPLCSDDFAFFERRYKWWQQGFLFLFPFLFF
jgi:hypothetical protein